MKKNLIATILAVAVMTAMAGCGSKQAETTQAGAETTTAAQAQESTKEAAADTTEYVVGFIAKNTNNEFHAVINSTAEKVLNQYKEEGLIKDWFLLDGLSDASVQVSLTDDAINMGANIIVVCPAEYEASAPVLDKCAEKNVPVFVVNSNTNNTEELAACYVTTDDVYGGELLGQFLVDNMPEGGGYCHSQGVIGNSAQIDRGKGIHDVLDKNDKFTCLDEQPGNWDPAMDLRNGEDWINKFGDKLNAVVCDYAGGAASIQALYNSIGRDDIICIGHDGTSAALQMIKDGTMKALVYQDGEGQMTTALEAMKSYIKGEDFEKTYILKPFYVDSTNVDEYLNK